MIDEELRGLADEPHNALARRGDEINDFLSHRTVAVSVYRDVIAQKNWFDQFSGIPVRLFGRAFILTAGHCIRSLRIEGMHAHVGVTDVPHLFTPRFVRTGGAFDEMGLDAGYIELTDVDAATMEAKHAVFSSEKRIEVATPEDLYRTRDPFVISGYPEKYTHRVNVAERHTREIVQFAIVQTRIGAPPAVVIDPYPPRPSDGANVVDAFLTRADMFRATSELIEPIEFPRMSGMSGGGVWRTNWRNHEDTWTAESLTLVGTHSGSPKTDVSYDGKPAVASREALIGHNLAAIARDYDELRDAIFHRWPMLASWR